MYFQKKRKKEERPWSRKIISHFHSGTVQVRLQTHFSRSRVGSSPTLARCWVFPMFFKLRSFPTLRWSRLFALLFQNKGVFTMGFFCWKVNSRGKSGKGTKKKNCVRCVAAFAFATAIGGSGQEDWVLLSATTSSKSWLVGVCGPLWDPIFPRLLLKIDKKS